MLHSWAPRGCRCCQGKSHDISALASHSFGISRRRSLSTGFHSLWDGRECAPLCMTEYRSCCVISLGFQPPAFFPVSQSPSKHVFHKISSLVSQRETLHRHTPSLVSGLAALSLPGDPWTWLGAGREMIHVFLLETDPVTHGAEL